MGSFTQTFHIDVDATKVEIGSSFLNDCVSLEADINETSIDSILDEMDKADIASYMESNGYLIAKEDETEELLSSIALDEVIDYLEEQGFKVTEE